VTKLRIWQQECENTILNEMYRIINALTGSGKSYLMRDMALIEAIQDGRRAIVAVPQEIIVASFTDSTSHIIMGETVENISDLVFNTFDYTNKQKALEEFKKSDKLLCLCSYQTLIFAFKNNNKIFDGMEVYIDEAHHIKAHEKDTLSNQMGGVIFDLVKRKKVHITLSSATIFRGDKISILDPSLKDRFIRYNLDVDSYLREMLYLKNIKIEVKTYDITKPFDKIKEAYVPGKKMLVYIPNVNTQEFKTIGSKSKWIKGLVASVGHPNSKISKPDSNGIITVKNGQTVKVLDLVTDETEHRKSAKNHLIKNQKTDDIDVVLALGMMKEGANYVCASEAHVFGLRNLKDTVQILGRVLRDYPGKETAKIIIYIAKSIATSGPQFKESVENYVKASLISMIIEDVIFDGELSVSKKKKSTGERVYDVWDNLNSEVKMNLLSDVSSALSDMDEKHSIDEYTSAIREVVDADPNTQNLCDEDRAIIVKRIYKNQVRNVLKNDIRFKGIDLDNVDYEVIKEEIGHPMGWLTLSTNDFGVTNFSDLRKACSYDIFSGTPEQLIVYAKEHGITNQKQHLDHMKLHPELRKVFPMSTNIVGWNHVYSIQGIYSGTPEQLIAYAKEHGITNQGQHINHMKLHPELKNVFPTTPNRIIGWEHVYSTTHYSGTPEQLIAYAKEHNITNQKQHRKHMESHPELYGVFPVTPRGAKGWEHVYLKVINGTYFGTPEQLIVYAKEHGITNQKQHSDHMKLHPELRKVFPMSTNTVGWEHVYSKAKPHGIYSGTPEQLIAYAKEHGITNEGQHRKHMESHPELYGVFPIQTNRTKGWKHVFQKEST
jgi:superfamily II DNA or RNA helicase